MNGAIYVVIVMVLWWLMSSTMRDLGLSWRALTLVAALYGTSAATLWLIHT